MSESAGIINPLRIRIYPAGVRYFLPLESAGLKGGWVPTSMAQNDCKGDLGEIWGPVDLGSRDHITAEFCIAARDQVFQFAQIIYVIHWVMLDNFASTSDAYADGQRQLAKLVRRLQTTDGPVLSSGSVQLSLGENTKAETVSNMTK